MPCYAEIPVLVQTIALQRIYLKNFNILDSREMIFKINN